MRLPGSRPWRLAALLLLTACTPATQGPATLPDTVAALPGPADQTRVRVLVMGDQGKGGEVPVRVAQAMQAICARDGCDLGVGLGDNFYPAGPRDAASPLFRERFEALYGPLRMPFLMLSGNHDQSWVWGGDGADPAGADVQVAYARTHPQWVMPARTYRAAVGDLVAFFAVDTVPLASSLPSVRPAERPGGPWDAAQRAWLAGALTSSQARWNLVLGHHPLFSNGRHGSAGAYDGLPFPLQRGDAVRALYGVACGRADVLLGGHDHLLALFAPQPECAGTWSLVSGAAGEVRPGMPGRRAAAFQSDAGPGFAWLEVTPDALTVRFYVLDATGAARLAHEERIRKPGTP